MIKVVFFCMADHAGSAYEAVQAINRVGRIQANHITLYNHPQGFPTEVLLDSSSRQGRGVVEEQPQYRRACELLENADYIHPWNDLYDHYDHIYGNDQYKSFWGHFPHYPAKCRTTTMTGTWYRIHHDMIDADMERNDRQLIVQTPAFLDEADFEGGGRVLIPHAIDTTHILPLAPEYKLRGSIGCYHHLRTTGTTDIVLLLKILRRRFPGWFIPAVMNQSKLYRLPQQTYKHLLSQCMLFMQHTDTRMISYGRSAVEAMAYGVPVLNSVCWQAKQRWPDLPIFNIKPETLEQVLEDVMDMDYNVISQDARHFTENVHSYEAVGEQYTQLFEGL